jgi:hypothetical protein
VLALALAPHALNHQDGVGRVMWRRPDETAVARRGRGPDVVGEDAVAPADAASARPEEAELPRGRLPSRRDGAAWTRLTTYWRTDGRVR